MARTPVLSGRSLLTERPYLDKRFPDLSNLTGDFGGETNLCAIAYDPRNKNALTGNALLWIAGDTNKKIILCDSVTMTPIASFPYPSAVSGSGSSTLPGPAQNCYGLAIIPTPTDIELYFLTEPGLDDTGCPILYQMHYDPSLSGPEQLVIDMWYYLSATPASNTFALVPGNRGMTEFKGDLMLIGAYQGQTTFAHINKYGQVLAIHRDVQTSDDPRGLLHMHDRVFSCMNDTTDPDIGGRYLGKFLTPTIEKVPGAFIPLLAIEPFFLPTFSGDLTLYQDNMAACTSDCVYVFKMIYFVFIVDDMATDDIDMGSVLIGDFKVKKIKFKNISDKYTLKDVTISKGSVTCPGGAEHCPASEAVTWATLSLTDPDTSTDPGIWVDTITFAQDRPYMNADAEVPFWIKLEIPTYYTNLFLPGGTSPRPVDPSDSPFVIPLDLSARLG